MNDDIFEIQYFILCSFIAFARISLFENSSGYRISNAIKPVHRLDETTTNIYMKRREKNPIANGNNHFICFESDVISDDTEDIQNKTKNHKCWSNEKLEKHS